MTYEEFLQHIEMAGLKVHQFAGLVKMHPNSISNYAKIGEVPSHLAIIGVLLEGLAMHGIDYHEMLSKIDITPKKPRGAVTAQRTSKRKTKRDQ